MSRIYEALQKAESERKTGQRSEGIERSERLLTESPTAKGSMTTAAVTEYEVPAGVPG